MKYSACGFWCFLQLRQVQPKSRLGSFGVARASPSHESFWMKKHNLCTSISCMFYQVVEIRTLHYHHYPSIAAGHAINFSLSLEIARRFLLEEDEQFCSHPERFCMRQAGRKFRLKGSISMAANVWDHISFYLCDRILLKLIGRRILQFTWMICTYSSSKLQYASCCCCCHRCRWCWR